MPIVSHVAEQAIEERVQQNPENIRKITEAFALIEPKFRDIFFQKSVKTAPTLADMFVTTRMLTALHDGEIKCSLVKLHEVPFPDAMASENDEIMASLPHPFDGRFCTGSNGVAGQDDGFVRWSEPILNGDGKSNTAPATVPLEVGTTSSGKTWLYLSSRGPGVARWPYKSDDLYILTSTKKWRDRLQVSRPSLKKMAERYKNKA